MGFLWWLFSRPADVVSTLATVLASLDRGSLIRKTYVLHDLPFKLTHQLIKSFLILFGHGSSLNFWGLLATSLPEKAKNFENISSRLLLLFSRKIAQFT